MQKPYIGLIAIGAISGMILLAGCGQEPKKTEAAGSAAPVPVHVVAAAQSAWPSTYEATGTVRARTAAVISSKVMGYVNDVRVQVGDRVREGQVLLRLDARDLDTNIRRAEAGVAETHAAVPEVENAVAAAKANLDLAKVTFQRMQELFDKKSISNQEYDEASAKLKAAQASYEMAVARRAQLKARTAQAEQERAAAEIMRGYAEIRAPFSGVVTAKSVDPGVLASPGVPLLTIEREGAYRLEALVEESRLGTIRVGAPVKVILEAGDRQMEARVSEIVPAVDAASRSYTVKIDLPPAPLLRSGSFGRAVFAEGTRTVLAVPANAVVERGQLQSVMVADNGTARARLITTGQRANNQVEVLSGLGAGENVIVPLPPGLTDGARVEVRP